MEKSNLTARTVGTVIRGIRAPIIRKGDNLVDIVTDCVLNSAKSDGLTFSDKDIIGITEAVVARAQGNYVAIDDIAVDIKEKFNNIAGSGDCGTPEQSKSEKIDRIDKIGLIFPILSRNRFAICLRGIALAAKKVYLLLSYPSDEVGNHLFDVDLFEDEMQKIENIGRCFDEKTYREKFGYSVHPFTGVDYVEYYKTIIEESGAEAEIIFSNSCYDILNYTQNILACDIHTRKSTKRKLISKNKDAKVFSLDEICTKSINGSGYNEEYGLLGSNKATETTLKLFPRDCKNFVNSLASKLKSSTNKQIEVLIYGDGAFKDPQGKIWELADPVVSPAYTEGLEGVPNEIKLKYLADNEFSHLEGEELEKAIKEYIKNKDSDLKASMASQGTTPRKITDLLGSLCDLSSGSGDKGTPIILIQGYFDNISS